MSGYNPAALRAECKAQAPGDPRMRALRNAAAEAERAGDPETALEFHHALIKESVFTGDRYQALVDFPQYLSLCRSDPRLEADRARERLWLFKWIVEASVEFFQIDKPQVLSWFAQFRCELTRHGYSSKPFFEKRAIFYSYYDRARMMLDYEDFLRSPRDAMADGEADEYDTMVRWELVLGNRSKAMRAAEHIFRNRLHTEEIPATTYGYLLEDAMRRDDRQEAAHYAALLRPLCKDQRMRLEQSGLLMIFDAQNDPASGLQYYVRHARIRRDSRNPLLCFRFDAGASMLLHAAAESGCTCPDPESPQQTWLPDDLAAQSRQLAEAARSLAERFDARNGSDFFSQACAQLPASH